MKVEFFVCGPYIQSRDRTVRVMVGWVAPLVAVVDIAVDCQGCILLDGHTWQVVLCFKSDADAAPNLVMVGWVPSSVAIADSTASVNCELFVLCFVVFLCALSSSRVYVQMP